MGHPVGETNLLEHLGWDLWRAAEAWQRRFTLAMRARGFAWFAEARGQLFRFIDAAGVAQGDLAEAAGMTKQAVQQHVDALVADGIVERIPDPADARRWRLRLTADGCRARDVARAIKAELESDYRRLLGAATLASVRAALVRIAEHDPAEPRRPASAKAPSRRG